MMNVKMRKFGSTLTDRADGKKSAEEIVRIHSSPIGLDFEGVMALGSSFGEEIILKLAPLQNNKITIMSVNNVVKNSLLRMVEDTEIDLIFVSAKR